MSGKVALPTMKIWGFFFCYLNTLTHTPVFEKDSNLQHPVKGARDIPLHLGQDKEQDKDIIILHSRQKWEGVYNRPDSSRKQADSISLIL